MIALLAKFPLVSHLFMAATLTPCKLPGTGTNSFFGFPHWWQYMQGAYDGIGTCTPVFHGPSDIFPIALAVINILLHIAGIAAFMGIIISGVSYIIAIGNSEKITSSRKGIQNSLIGLAIAFVAAAAVGFVGKSLAG